MGSASSAFGIGKGVIIWGSCVFSVAVASIVVRGHQMARQEALTQLDHVRQRVPEMRALTSSISADDRQARRRLTISNRF